MKCRATGSPSRCPRRSARRCFEHACLGRPRAGICQSRSDPLHRRESLDRKAFRPDPERKAFVSRMTRSRAPLLWALLVAAASDAACSRAGRTAAAVPPPSVLIVSIDTLRADRVGAYGSKLGATPNLDRLAARGAVFENAFTTAPLTLPAHASLFSGLWPFHHGARVNGADSIASDAPLLAERMRAAGMRTGAVVGSLVLRSQTGLARGFESYDDRFEENRARVQRDWN